MWIKKVTWGWLWLSCSDEKSQLNVEVWKHSSGSLTARVSLSWVMQFPLPASESEQQQDLRHECGGVCGKWVCHPWIISGLYFITHFLKKIRNDTGILLNIKLNSALLMACVFASEFICKTAGNAAAILKCGVCVSDPRGNLCSTYRPLLGILLLVQVEGFGGEDSKRGLQLQGFCTCSIRLISKLGNSHSSHP